MRKVQPDLCLQTRLAALLFFLPIGRLPAVCGTPVQTAHPGPFPAFWPSGAPAAPADLLPHMTGKEQPLDIFSGEQKSILAYGLASLPQSQSRHPIILGHNNVSFFHFIGQAQIGAVPPFVHRDHPAVSVINPVAGVGDHHQRDVLFPAQPDDDLPHRAGIGIHQNPQAAPSFLRKSGSRLAAALLFCLLFRNPRPLPDPSSGNPPPFSRPCPGNHLRNPESYQRRTKRPAWD